MPTATWSAAHACDGRCVIVNQTLRRKQVFGDVTCIVFQTGDTPFRPDCIRSHFVHVIIVVQAQGTPADRTYRVAGASHVE